MSSHDRIASILGEWQERRDRGEAVDPEDVIAEHPDLAEELRAKFEALAPLDATRAGEARSSSPTRLRELALDRYADFRPAGEGGMGIVYWAIDTDLNREVAFKVIRPGVQEADATTPAAPIELSAPAKDTPASQAFETLKQRFLQEAWVTGGLSHPGIVPVYELGETPEGVPYYTMRFIKGERTLADAIEDAKDRDIEERLKLLEPFLKVCDTLSYAHAKGVIHRDLKPDNIALGEFGEVVVIDWGLAKIKDRPDVTQERWQDRIQEYREATDLRTVASALGTPGYMAPEAAKGQADQMDARSDVYSLGAILFQILTGRLPFEFTTFGELVTKLLKTEAPRAKDLDDAVPEALSGLCTRCLARELGARPANADALAEAIRTWQVEREREREIEGLLREAKTALAAAEELKGADMLQQVDRATASVRQVLDRRPQRPRALDLQQEAEALRERGIAERERGARRKVLARGGVAVLAGAVVAVLLVAGALDRKAREAQRERDAKATALRDVLRLADAKQARDLEDEAHALSATTPDLDEVARRWLVRADELGARGAEHAAALATLRARASATPPPWRFASSELDWQHEVLSDLVERLRRLLAKDEPLRSRVEHLYRLGVALRGATTRHASEWKETVAEIAASDVYKGLRLVVQRGLVPLGRDPDSGLFEFGHVGSGGLPTRDAESGRLVLRDQTAIVFVLIPAATDTIGSEKSDDAREVTLEPFFLAKHECTQAQWRALSWGTTPSMHEGDRRPVECVSWDDCVAALGEHGLVLPSEAQWEVACRAGTDTPWWPGEDVASIDATDWNKENSGGWHHPVGGKRANPFGLHDLHGNVSEWCSDVPGEPGGQGMRPARGGNFSELGKGARSSSWGWVGRTWRRGWLGIRPARAVEGGDSATVSDPEEEGDTTYVLRLAAMLLLDYEAKPRVAWQERRRVTLGERFEVEATVAMPERPALRSLTSGHDHHVSFGLPGFPSRPPGKGTAYFWTDEFHVSLQVSVAKVKAGIEEVPGANVSAHAEPGQGEWTRFTIEGPSGRVFGASVALGPQWPPWHDGEIRIVGSLSAVDDGEEERTVDAWEAAYARGMAEVAAALVAAHERSSGERHRVSYREERTFDSLRGLANLLPSPALAPSLADIASTSNIRGWQADLAALRLLCNDEAAWKQGIWADDQDRARSPAFWTRVALRSKGQQRARALAFFDDVSPEDGPYALRNAYRPLYRAVTSGNLPAPAWLARLQESRHANDRRALLYALAVLGAAALLLALVLAPARTHVAAWFLPLILGLVLCALRWRHGSQVVHVEVAGLLLVAGATWALCRRSGFTRLVACAFAGALLLSLVATLLPSAAWPVAAAVGILTAVGMTFLIGLRTRLAGGPKVMEEFSLGAGMLMYALPATVYVLGSGTLHWVVALPAISFLGWTAMTLLAVPTEIAGSPIEMRRDES